MFHLVPFRTRATSTLALVLATGLSACGGRADVAGTVPAVATSLTDTRSQVARSQDGMVASASRYATEVGARVLAEGGNAVDAAAATAFALAVTEPPMSGLGGRASTVIRTPDGEVYGIDGLNQVPRGYASPSEADSTTPRLPAGYDRAAIPGVPAALIHMVERYGSWPLERIVAPAIRLAEEGFVLTEEVADLMAGAADDLREYEASRRYFLKPDGSPYAAGEVFVQRDLARTLRGIAEGGAAAFYRGWIADSIHADMTRAGGFITRNELAGYEALPAILVRGSYRGYALSSVYQPASGHTVIEALRIMEHFPLADMEAAERASITAQAMQLALSDRSRRFGSEEESAARLTSEEWAAQRAREIAGPRIGGLPAAGRVGAVRAREALGHGASSSVGGDAARGSGGQLVPAGSADAAGAWWLRPDQGHTTHLSVVDRNGLAVAHTQSLGPGMGTGLAASGLGFLYATRLGSMPGSRPGSTISPTIVTDGEGRLRWVLGAAGDSRIITAVIQTLSRAIDQGLPLERAVESPRVHPMGTTTVRVERDARIRWSDAETERLRQLGFDVQPSPSSYFARVHAIEVDRGTLIGVADPRRTGTAVGVR